MSLSTSDPFFDAIDQLVKERSLPGKFSTLIKSCYLRYLEAVPQEKKDAASQLFKTYLKLIALQLKKPHLFSLYHDKIEEYERFGLAFMEPLIIFEKSKLLGKTLFKQAEEQIEAGENVIFLANHQTEPDPQILLLLLQNEFPKLAKALSFVAGDRVTTDPMAVPFSLGCNLFCIYSKKHIDHPPELKAEKLTRNQKTLKALAERLNKGGAAIYIAPSGGRDRPDESGVFQVAPYDPQSIEMLALFAEGALRKTHFYPLALKTHAILPPPSSVDIELGEERVASRSPVGVAVGEEIVMQRITGDAKRKREERQKRAETILSSVIALYNQLS